MKTHPSVAVGLLGKAKSFASLFRNLFTPRKAKGKPVRAVSENLESRTLLSNAVIDYTLTGDWLFEPDEYTAGVAFEGTEFTLTPIISDPEEDPYDIFVDWADIYGSYAWEELPEFLTRTLPDGTAYGDTSFWLGASDPNQHNYNNYVDIPMWIWNLAPEATLGLENDEEEDIIIARLNNPTDAGPADVAAGLKFSFSLNPGDLAINYATASSSNSASFNIDDFVAGGGVVYSRIFDQDDDYSGYSTNARKATLTMGQVPSDSATFSWDQQLEQGDNAKWRIQRLDSPTGTFQTVANNLEKETYYWIDTSVQEDHRYWYRVRAYNETGVAEMVYSQKVLARTKLNTPLNVTVTALSGNQIEVVWTDESDAELEYRIYRSADDGETWELAGTVGEDETEFTDTGVADLTTYLYYVQAYKNEEGSINYSADSATDSATTPLAAATQVGTQVVSNTSVTIHWQDNSSWEEEYEIYRSVDEGENWSLVDTVGENETSFTDIGLSVNTGYQYKVLTIKTGETAAESDDAAVFILPMPTNVEVEDLAHSNVIEVRWDAPSSDYYAGFVISVYQGGTEMSEASLLGEWDIEDTAAGTGKSFKLTDPGNTGDYQFTLHAYGMTALSASNNSSSGRAGPFLPQFGFDWHPVYVYGGFPDVLEDLVPPDPPDGRHYPFYAQYAASNLIGSPSLGGDQEIEAVPGIGVDWIEGVGLETGWWGTPAHPGSLLDDDAVKLQLTNLPKHSKVRAQILVALVPDANNYDPNSWNSGNAGGTLKLGSSTAQAVKADGPGNTPAWRQVQVGPSTYKYIGVLTASRETLHRMPTVTMTFKLDSLPGNFRWEPMGITKIEIFGPEPGTDPLQPPPPPPPPGGTLPPPPPPIPPYPGPGPVDDPPDEDPDPGEGGFGSPDPDENQVNLIVAGWDGFDYWPSWYNETVPNFARYYGSSTDGAMPEAVPSDLSVFMPVNDDFDEGNLDANDDLVPDNQPDYLDGDRVDYDVVPFRLFFASGETDSEDIEENPASFWLNFPDELVKVWRPDPDDIYKWIEVEEGHEFEWEDWADWYSSTDYNWQTPAFVLEAIDASTSLHDITLTAGFDKGDAGLAEDIARFTAMPSPDVDIDSDNDEGFDEPLGDDDEIEDIRNDSRYPGKIIIVNDDDTDADGIPDYADFDIIETPDGDPVDEQFVPITVNLPEPYDLETAKIYFHYSGSDPLAVTSKTDGVSGITTYTPASGTLRLWAKPGDEVRDPDQLNDSGDYLRPGVKYGWANFSETERTITLWVEAINPSPWLAGSSIGVWVDPDGNGPAAMISSDYVQLTALKINLDVNDNGTLHDTMDGAVNYLSGYMPKTQFSTELIPVLSTGAAYNGHTYQGQEMRLILQGFGQDGSGLDVKFKIGSDVTHYGGYAGNVTNSTILGTDKEQDFSFNEVQDDREEVAATNNAQQWVALWAKDYGGWAKITVEATINGATMTLYEFTVPHDTDDDKIADRWEREMVKKWNTQFGSNETVGMDFFEPSPSLAGGNHNDAELKDPDGSANFLKFSPPAGTTLIDFGEHADAGDGRGLLEEYRGHILDRGGYDWDGNNWHNGGHTRLSPAYKELLVEVDAMSGIIQLAVNGETTIKSWMDYVAWHLSKKTDGAGIRMYYVLDNLATTSHESGFLGETGETAYRNYLKANRQLGTGEDGEPSGANTIFNSTTMPYPRFTHLQLVKVLGWVGNRGWTVANRQTGVAVDWLHSSWTAGFWGTPPPAYATTFDNLMISYISHELHHTYAWDIVPGAGGHVADTNGNGTPNEADDFTRVLFDYDQQIPPTGYNNQDYAQTKYGRGTTQYISIE